MLILLVGTGIFLTVRTRFLTWRNLGYALKSTLSKEARTKSRGQGDVSPFSALTTALAATIGTGNIVGVATAMVSGGPRSSGMELLRYRQRTDGYPEPDLHAPVKRRDCQRCKRFQPEN